MFCLKTSPIKIYYYICVQKPSLSSSGYHRDRFPGRFISSLKPTQRTREPENPSVRRAGAERKPGEFILLYYLNSSPSFQLIFVFLRFILLNDAAVWGYFDGTYSFKHFSVFFLDYSFLFSLFHCFLFILSYFGLINVFRSF